MYEANTNIFSHRVHIGFEISFNLAMKWHLHLSIPSKILLVVIFFLKKIVGHGLKGFPTKIKHITQFKITGLSALVSVIFSHNSSFFSMF